MNILITGSTDYPSTNKIKRLLYNIKQTKGTDNIIIASRDNDGVDKIVKKYALDFDFEYGIFNLYNQNQNMFSIMPKWKFNKEYSAKLFYWRDNDAIKWADMVILFCEKINYMQIKNLVKLLKNTTKYVKIIN